MPVPFPTPDKVRHTAPDAAEAAFVARGVIGAVTGDAGLTALQDVLIRAQFQAMTGFDVDPAQVTPIGPAEFAAGMAHRDLIFRTRVVQVMLLSAWVLTPLPAEVVNRLRAFAEELGVNDDMIDVAEAYASGALDLAAADFGRNGYLAAVDPGRLRAVHASALSTAWGEVSDDAILAGRWQSLEELPVGTVGRGVVDFYRDRGFVYPGRPGSAPPLLAQHDWVHVLAGYGTTVENEIEVFGFIARSNDDPRAFSLLAMILSLFETGYLASGAGLFEADAGHLRRSGMAVRLADAMRRGALTTGSHDFLELDWFAVADRPVGVLREEIGLVGKSSSAVAAGSVGPWETGGISPYQLAAARRRSAELGGEYRPWQPDPARA